MSRDAPWQATILTLFPDAFPGILGQSLAGRALAADLWQLQTVHLRDFAYGKHRLVDDTPFGGGPGMVIRPDVVAAALASVGRPGAAPLSLAARAAIGSAAGA